MSRLFDDDGCVIPNIPTRIYRVTFLADCKHTKVIGGQLLIRAISASAAESYAMTWLRIPQTHVASVAEVTESEPAGQR